MQSEERDGTIERRLIIAAIVNTEFLSRVVGRVDSNPFQSRWTNLIYRWCCEHFLKYGTAPGPTIESLYEAWVGTSPDKGDRDAISRLLSQLSQQSDRLEDVDVGYVIDLAEKHFNDVRLTSLVEGLRSESSRGLTQSSLTLVQNFRPLRLSSPPYIDLLVDQAAQKQALSEQQKVLITLPGAANRFFGEELAEDSFVAFMAASKGTKSFTLLSLAWLAFRQHRHVAYFQVGDLTLNQVIRRFHRRAAYRPLRAETIFYPTSIYLPPENKKPLAQVEFKDITYEQPIQWDMARRAYEKAAAASKGSIRISYHPTMTVTINDVKDILDQWDKTGWKAQVVVIDYMGNLAPVDHRAKPVDQVTYSWAIARQISESRKCLVITANQSNKEGFSSWVLTRKHFADSKMILAHCTAFAGINRTDEEVQSKVIRYNWVVSREGTFSETQCLYCGHCLALANPMVVTAL